MYFKKLGGCSEKSKPEGSFESFVKEKSLASHFPWPLRKVRQVRDTWVGHTIDTTCVVRSHSVVRRVSSKIISGFVQMCHFVNQLDYATLPCCQKWPVGNLHIHLWNCYGQKSNPVKFIYSEKATKFCEICTLLLTATT